MQKMQMLRTKLFDGEDKVLEVYNEMPLIDVAIDFFLEECEEEEDFTFPNYLSAYFRVFNERLGRRIKNITNISQSGSALIINASVLDMTFEDNGNYHYEIGYISTGGYEFPLRYGKLQVI